MSNPKHDPNFWTGKAVTFGKGIDDWDEWLVCGMRGRIVRIEPHRDMFKVMVDTTEFEEFNRPLEEANFYPQSSTDNGYGSSNSATVTAREAGAFDLKVNGYCDAPETWAKSFTLLEEEPALTQIMARHQVSAAEMPYTQYLERELIAAMELGYAPGQHRAPYEIPKELHDLFGAISALTGYYVNPALPDSAEIGIIKRDLLNLFVAHDAFEQSLRDLDDAERAAP